MRGESVMARGRLAGVALGVAVSCVAQAWPVAAAQAGCGVGGYRVVGERWDAVLGTGWEMRQDCAHPEWPARAVAVSTRPIGAVVRAAESARENVGRALEPVLVRAGERVRLWFVDATVHIEMSGVAEQPARMGERVTVRVERQDGDAGLRVEHIAGMVRGAGDVEMGR